MSETQRLFGRVALKSRSSTFDAFACVSFARVVTRKQRWHNYALDSA
ncbi:Hypothetical protein I5071_820 (plasmid) [Sandaracinus amylolyticus]|nr:Hypothetical protein I5071_820 [Sandaracinus amylolyticus]